MPELTIDEIIESDTPYLDVFGVEVRSRGRRDGDFLDFSTSLNMPPGHKVPNREEARKMRARVRGRALAVLEKVYAKELKAIYKAELDLELDRVDPERLEGSGAKAKKTTKKRIRVSEADAKATPGSGYLPGQTYSEWMATYTQKGDAEWDIEKPVAKENLRKIMKGESDGD